MPEPRLVIFDKLIAETQRLSVVLNNNNSTLWVSLPVDVCNYINNKFSFFDVSYSSVKIRPGTINTNQPLNLNFLPFYQIISDQYDLTAINQFVNTAQDFSTALAPCLVECYKQKYNVRAGKIKHGILFSELVHYYHHLLINMHGAYEDNARRIDFLVHPSQYSDIGEILAANATLCAYFRNVHCFTSNDCIETKAIVSNELYFRRATPSVTEKLSLFCTWNIFNHVYSGLVAHNKGVNRPVQLDLGLYPIL